MVHLSDGGPDHRAARQPVVGAGRVAQLFIGLVKRFEEGIELHEVEANGQRAAYYTLGGDPYMLHVANWVDGKMTGSFALLNTEKLESFHREWRRRDDE